MATAPFTPSTSKVLVFDIYGTLVDWETGISTALTPLFSRIPFPPSTIDRKFILSAYTTLEHSTQEAHPSLPYNKVLESVFQQLCSRFKLNYEEEEAVQFGGSIGTWPAFPDTVAAMQALGKHYKLVALSNVDKQSFSNSLAGPIKGVTFDAILTAEEIGSYKPSLHNFDFMLKRVHEQFGVEKDEVWIVAQSLFHDHRPAKKVGLKPGIWIARSGGDGEEASMGGTLEDCGTQVELAGVFMTLGEFAKAVEEAGE